ncbi:MAG TPA: hypothetical protein DCF33_14565 [Saprospirales bacterium]|nr:hypothetical protein [Saprospirales bacterium]
MKKRIIAVLKQVYDIKKYPAFQTQTYTPNKILDLLHPNHFRRKSAKKKILFFILAADCASFRLAIPAASLPLPAFPNKILV